MNPVSLVARNPVLQFDAVRCTEMQCVSVLLPQLYIFGGEKSCVAVWCSVLQRVAVCMCAASTNSVSWAARNLVMQCGAMCCSVVQCVVLSCTVLQCGAVCCSVVQCGAVCCGELQCVCVLFPRTLYLRWRRNPVLQHVAACCSELQCSVVWCSVLQ